MASTGFFTLATAASVVTIGLAYDCDLQSLPLDVGEPSIQGVVKKITAVDVRVVDTLGLQIGSSFDDLVDMQDLVIGNLSSALTGQTTQVVSDLVTGDAITYLDPTYTVPGQYCIRQDKPYPATIAGLFPRFEGEKRNER
jgi:nitrous oxidase accessory protein NosD